MGNFKAVYRQWAAVHLLRSHAEAAGHGAANSRLEA